MKDKSWIKDLIWAVVILSLTIPTFFGFKSNNEALETICKMLSGAGIAGVVVSSTFMFKTISINIKTIKVDNSKTDNSKHDDHSKTDNSFRVDNYSKQIDNSVHNEHIENTDNLINDSTVFIAGNSTNNGIQANVIEQVVIPEKKKVNEEERKHCQYIKEEMDALFAFMDYIYNDPLNVYTGRGILPDGTFYEGDYKNLYNLNDYLSKKSVVFNDETLRNSVTRLKGAIAQFYWDLGLYTRSYGDGTKVRDKWSLYYLINEHPKIYFDEFGSHITKEVEEKAVECLHALQKDKSDLEFAYNEFVNLYNSLI